MITDPKKAREVGTRHGVPVVIEVDIQALIDDTSQLVYESSNGYIPNRTCTTEIFKNL